MDYIEIDIAYNHQFVMNETQHGTKTGKQTTQYNLERTPVVNGTFVGRIIADGETIQTFCQPVENDISLTEVVSSDKQIVSMSIDRISGIVSATWNGKAPKTSQIVASYEYNVE